MSHSHIPVRHLIRQLDGLRSQRRTRDRRPAWLVEFIDSAAEWFNPLAGVGRVGFDALPVDGRWEVALYLGSTEVVGGPQDGESRPAAFSFDLRGLMRSFSRIDQLSWTAEPGPPGVDGAPGRIEARVTIAGLVGEQPVVLQICSLPPQEAGPGFRQYANGRCDAV